LRIWNVSLSSQNSSQLEFEFHSSSLPYTNPMELSPPETDNYFICLEILRLFWNPKVHYCVHRISALDPIVIHLNPVKNLTLYYRKIRFNIINFRHCCSCLLSVLLHGCRSRRDQDGSASAPSHQRVP
jgi:hypothetical protein